MNNANFKETKVGRFVFLKSDQDCIICRLEFVEVDGNGIACKEVRESDKVSGM